MKYDLSIFHIDPKDGGEIIEVAVPTKDLNRLRLLIQSGADALADDLRVAEQMMRDVALDKAKDALLEEFSKGVPA